MCRYETLFAIHNARTIHIKYERKRERERENERVLLIQGKKEKKEENTLKTNKQTHTTK